MKIINYCGVIIFLKNNSTQQKHLLKHSALFKRHHTAINGAIARLAIQQALRIRTQDVLYNSGLAFDNCRILGWSLGASE
jgi:hypothetical protein